MHYYFAPAALLVFFCVCSGRVMAWSSSAVSIDVINSLSDKRESAIEKMLQLQRSLLIDPNSENLSQEDQEKGFLLIKMSHAFVDQLIAENRAVIIMAALGKETVGYILLTEIAEFQKLCATPVTGYFKSSSPLIEDSPEIMYIEQIAVKRGLSKRGIGTALLNAAKQLAPKGLLADVFIAPLKNHASHAFFTRSGFKEIGTLHQEATPYFVAHQTRVFFLSSRDY